jgi:ribonuclease BN (tRNA processing enzyme)
VIAQIKDLLEYGYRGLAARYKYPIEYIEAKPGETRQIAGLTLDFAPSRHAVTNLAVRIESEGKRFCYSGDGMFTDEGRELFGGADLLIHEAYFFDQSPVHADIGALLEMYGQAGVRRMALVHVQRNLRREPFLIQHAIRQGGHAERVSLPEPGTALEVL